jgi:hypothetical protein
MTISQNVIGFQTDPHTAAFSDTLRAAIRSRGLTLDRIQWHLALRGLKVGMSSLSDWQHGRSVPASSKSLRAVRAMEEILDLGTGTLSTPLSAARCRPATTAPHAPRSSPQRPGSYRPEGYPSGPYLSPRRTPGPLAPEPVAPAPGAPVPDAPDGLNESDGPLGDLLRDLADTRDAFAMLARSCRVRVDSRRRASVMRDHTVIRSRMAGADRYVMRYIGDPGCDIEAVTFTRLDNCSLGRVIRHETEPVLVAELLFDHPLAVGESWVFDTELIDETGEPCTDMGHGFVQQVDQFDLEVEFDPSLRPVDCHGFVESGFYTGQWRTQDLQLSDHRTVHVVASDVRAGVVGIAWSWADEAID